MLGGWLHDAAAATSESVVQLPFARGGSKAPGRRAGGQLGERQPPSPRHRHHDGEGAALGLDPSSVVEAHRHATAAEEARRAGRLQESLQEHVEAARCFLEAAERLPDVNGVTGAALVLLSDGHARQAKTLQQVLRRSGAGNGAKARKRPLPTTLLQQQPPQAPPAPTSSPPPQLPPGSGSMYASALGPDGGGGGNKERAWAAQVDDMLALEKRLQAIGSQPVFSGAGSFVHAAHAHDGAGAGGAGAGGGGHGPRYLSSTLGDSFFLVSNRHAANREAAWGEATAGGGGSSALLGSSSRLPPPASTKGGGGGGGLRMDAAAAAALRGSRQGAAGGGGGKNVGAGGGGMPRAASSTSLAAATGATAGAGAAAGGGRPQPTGVGAASASVSAAGGPRGGFLDGVESVQQGEVMRLLGCMKTLGDENAALIRQVEDGARIKQENERLRRELAEFRELYNSRFKQLRAALEEFRQRYPHEHNPANHVASSVDRARIKALEAEVEQLYGRLNREKEAGRKKDAMIRRYEQWYKTLKASAQSKSRANAAAAAQAAQQGAGQQGAGSSSSAVARNAAAAAGVASAASASASASVAGGRMSGSSIGGSSSGMRPPGRS